MMLSSGNNSYGLKKFPRHLAYTFQTGIHPSLGSVVVAIEPAVRRIPYGPVNTCFSLGGRT